MTPLTSQTTGRITPEPSSRQAISAPSSPSSRFSTQSASSLLRYNSSSLYPTPSTSYGFLDKVFSPGPFDTPSSCNGSRSSLEVDAFSSAHASDEEHNSAPEMLDPPGISSALFRSGLASLPDPIRGDTKPSPTVNQLIAAALYNGPLSALDICEAIKDRYSYYADAKKFKHLRNTVRHHLSKSKIFARHSQWVGTKGNGGLWTISDRRERSRSNASARAEGSTSRRSRSSTTTSRVQTTYPLQLGLSALQSSDDLSFANPISARAGAFPATTSLLIPDTRSRLLAAPSTSSGYFGVDSAVFSGAAPDQSDQPAVGSANEPYAGLWPIDQSSFFDTNDDYASILIGTSAFDNDASLSINLQYGLSNTGLDPDFHV